MGHVITGIYQKKKKNKYIYITYKKKKNSCDTHEFSILVQKGVICKVNMGIAPEVEHRCVFGSPKCEKSNISSSPGIFHHRCFKIVLQGIREEFIRLVEKDKDKGFQINESFK